MRSTRPISSTESDEKYFEFDKDAVRNVIREFLNGVMEAEACEQAGARPYERTDGRMAYRNGSKNRDLVTRYGRVELKKPQLRGVPFETSVFARYSRAEQAIVNTICESYLQGISTRKMKNVLSLLDVDVSRSTVSRITKELDEAVHEFLSRPLGVMPYIYVDATYIKVRDHGMYLSKAVYTAMGINEEGYKEMIGVRVMQREDEDSWKEFFQELLKRGLQGVRLVVSDGHRGIKQAVRKEFLGSAWQYCHVHFRRNVLKTVPMKERRAVNELLKEHMESPHLLANFSEELKAKGYEKAGSIIEKNLEDLFNYLAFPAYQWPKLRTTNTLENIHSVIKKRIKPIGAFPNDDSVLRVVVSMLIDVNEEFATDKRHINVYRNEQ
ncbi:IS256 family transposase [Methanocella paludicola]|nr:IS256 family transposase [Methanocella paludicola]